MELNKNLEGLASRAECSGGAVVFQHSPLAMVKMPKQGDLVQPGRSNPSLSSSLLLLAFDSTSELEHQVLFVTKA
jgi:hypothetical protein